MEEGTGRTELNERTNCGRGSGEDGRDSKGNARVCSADRGGPYGRYREGDEAVCIGECKGCASVWNASMGERKGVKR